MFQRKWILTTLLVVAAVAVMIRLGIWQLDRLEQRRAFNARVEAQISQAALQLNTSTPDASLTEMEYRQAEALGEYDFTNQIALRNQALNGQWGVHLLTPLRISGSDAAILVDRGWIPGSVYESGDWSRYNQAGEVEVRGVIRRSQSHPDFGRRSDPTPVPGGPRLETWNLVNVDSIAKQLPYPLYPVYLQETPQGLGVALLADTGSSMLNSGMPSDRSLEPGAIPERPISTRPQLELSEGSHMGYAIQWFLFAIILGVGYPFFIRKTEKDSAREKRKTGRDEKAVAASNQEEASSKGGL